MPDGDDENNNNLGGLHEERERRRQEREAEQRRNNPNQPANGEPGEDEEGLIRQMINRIRDDPRENR